MEPNSLITIARTNPEIILIIVHVATAICILITAFFTACAACAAKSSAKAAMQTAKAAMQTAKATERAVEATKQVAQGQFFFQLLSEYFSEQMADARKNLRAYDNNHNKIEKSDRRKKRLSEGMIYNAELEEQHAPLISRYFQRILALYDQKYIHREIFEEICRLPDFDLLFRVAEWHEKYDYNRDNFSRILGHSGLSEDEKQKLETARLPKKEVNPTS